MNKLLLLLTCFSLQAQTTVRSTGITTVRSTGVTTIVTNSLSNYPLDLFTARVGYDLHEIKTGYTGELINVRRTSDSVTNSFYQGATAGSLDTVRGGGGTDLATFCAGTDGVVVRWDDQTGNGLHLIQTTTGSQPKIVSAGVIITGANGKPAIQFDNSDDYLQVTATVASLAAHTAWAVFNVTGFDTANASWYFNDQIFMLQKVSDNIETGLPLHSVNGIGIGGYDGTTPAQYIAAITATWYLAELRHDTGNIYISKNGGADAGPTALGNLHGNPDTVIVGRNSIAGTSYFNGKMQSLIITDTIPANRSTINAVIRTYYGL